MNTPMWMVRASGQAARSGVFFESGVVALGVGQELGAIPEYAKPEDLHEALRRAHPSWRPGRHKAVAGQLHCFLREMRPGDSVMNWDSRFRRFCIGTVTSDARWAPDATGALPFVRDVNWTHEVFPSDLTPDGRAALNVIQTLFVVGRGIAAEVLRTARPLRNAPDGRADGALETFEIPLPVQAEPPAPTLSEPAPPEPAPPEPAPPADEESSTRPLAADASAAPTPEARPTPDAPVDEGPTEVMVELDEVEEIELDPPSDPPGVVAPELPPAPAPSAAVDAPAGKAGLASAAVHKVEARLANLEPDALRAVLAGVLRAQGFPHRTVDPETGADLFTGPALRGAAEPPLRAHLLSGGPVSAEQVQAAVADRTGGERWLLFAADGFSRDARRVVEDLSPDAVQVRLLDAADLAARVLQTYEDLDLATRSLVPLVRVWWPAWDDAP